MLYLIILSVYVHALPLFQVMLSVDAHLVVEGKCNISPILILCIYVCIGIESVVLQQSTGRVHFFYLVPAHITPLPLRTTFLFGPEDRQERERDPQGRGSSDIRI